MKKLLCGTALLAVMASSNANAATDAETINTLQKQLSAMQEQINNMQKQMEENTIAAAEPASGKGTSNVIGDVKITMKPSPKIESTDGRFAFQPFGRVHLDTTFFDDDLKENGDNVNFRRARLGFKGKIDQDWKYKFEMDFARELSNFKEVSLTYTGLEDLDIKAGHFKPFFGMDENQSSNYIQFVERAAASNTFARDEEIGLGILSGGDDWSFAIGAFNEDGGTDRASTDEEAKTVDARASYAPINKKGEVLHLGAAISHRIPDAASDAVTFSRRVAGRGSNLISTGAITGVDSTTLYSLEAAAVLGSFATQAEYFKTSVDRNTAADADFDSWYAQASYLLTGESRPYSGKVGNFKRIKPTEPFSLTDGGIGAWEVAARYSNTDLNDASAGITGGELEDWTAGVNWYINNNTRLMANYIWTDTDVNAVVANDSPEVFILRAAWDF